MTSSPFNWSKLIAGIRDDSSGVPTDVTFQIMEERGDGRTLREVSAHKMILAMVSPNLKKHFATNKTVSFIVLEKTTEPAFRIMMDAVYNIKSLEDSFKGKSVRDVFDVVSLIERFQIAELKGQAKKYLANYPVIEDSVLDVAEEAMEFTTMFQSDAQLILDACSKLLKTKLKDVTSMIKYGCAEKNRDPTSVLGTLLALMPSECSNCKKEICQDGRAINQDDFRVGLLLTNTRARFDRGTGRVTKVQDSLMTIESVKPGVTQNGVTGGKWDGGTNYIKRDPIDDQPLYLFDCN